MRKYRSNASSRERILYADESIAALEGNSKTVDLAGVFAAVNEKLLASMRAREEAERPVARKRAVLKRMDVDQVDPEIRLLGNDLEGAEEGRRGPLFDAVFPNGTSAVTVYSAGPQVEALGALVERLRNCHLSGIEPHQDKWIVRLEAAKTNLAGAVADYAASTAERDRLFGIEKAARDEHEFVLDKIMGEVRSRFAKDRRSQDSFFPY